MRKLFFVITQLDRDGYPPQPLPHLQPEPHPQLPPQQDISSIWSTSAQKQVLLLKKKVNCLLLMLVVRKEPARAGV
jgi:hypothetical protein